MANKRIIDLTAASTLVSMQMEIAGADGISKKTPFVDPNTKVASVGAGAGITIGGTTTAPTVINNGVRTLSGDGVDNADPRNPVIFFPSSVYHKFISSAEILSLFSTPIEVIPAAGANKVAIPKSWTTRYNFVSAGYATETNLMIHCLSIFWMPQLDILGNVANRFCIQFPSVNNQVLLSLAAFANQPFMISAQAANPTAGDSTVDTYIAYDIIDIS